MAEVEHSEVRDATANYILDELVPTTDPDELTSSTNLIEEEFLDSLGIFAVVAFLEERFGIEIDPEDVTIENFETIDAICDLVAEDSKDGAMTATHGADRPPRLGGNPTLTVLVRANDDVRDCVQSRVEGGKKLDRGLADRIRAQTGGSVTADLRHRPAGPAEQVLAELGAAPEQLREADVLLLSIEPDVTARRSGIDVTARYVSAMGDLAQLVKENDAHLIVFNGSTLDPDDTTSCYHDVAEPPSLVIHRLNLALMELSVLDGLSIIDVDRVIAELAGRRSVDGLLSYAPHACDAICDEVLRVLDDYGFFDDRPLLAQVGRRPR